MARGKPKLVDRPVEKAVSLPESIVAQVDLQLYSDLEGKVPHGAWARYIRRLIDQDLQRIAKEEK